jgi:hypothetical protein
MRDAYSEYVALLDHIEHIPVASSEASRLSPEECAVVMARIAKFVRDRVLAQSDLEAERLGALLHGGVAAVAGEREALRRTPDHHAIVELIDELAHVDPRDRVRVQTLLYGLYAAIAGHFVEAELIVASASEGERDYVSPSAWFG